MSKKLTLWIARDRDNDLSAYNQKPKRISEYGTFYVDSVYNRLSLKDIYLPEVIYENSPKKCKLIIED